MLFRSPFIIANEGRACRTSKEGRMRVLAGDEMMQDIDGRHLVVYAAFLDGAEVDYDKE